MSRRFLVSLAATAVIAGLAVAAYLLFVRAGGGDGAKLHASDLTVEDLYAAVDARVAASTGVLHLRRTLVSDGFYPAKATADTWIAPAEPRVRERMTYEAGGNTGTSETLTTPDERFTVDDPSRTPDGRVSSSEYWRCYATSVAVAALLPCPSSDAEVERRVEEGRYRGRDVLVLIEHGTTGSETKQRITTHTYIDAHSLLPFRRESAGVFLLPLPAPFTIREEIELVEDDAMLPPDFFEPAAIGYVAPDPLEGIKAVDDMQVYWLGRELSLPGGEKLVLASSYAAPAPGQPYRLTIQYATEASPHQPPFLTLMVFRRDMWERSPAVAAQALTIGDVVVFANAQSLPGQNSLVAPPNSYEYILSRLKPYEP